MYSWPARPTLFRVLLLMNAKCQVNEIDLSECQDATYSLLQVLMA